MGICFSSEAGGDVGGSGGSSKNPPVIFFPDAKMPCKSIMPGGGPCTRGPRCNFAHEETSLSRFLSILNKARKHKKKQWEAKAKGIYHMKKKLVEPYTLNTRIIVSFRF